MATCADHAGQGEAAAFRHVKIRGDRKIRPAVEDYIFDPIGVPLDGAGHACVERRLLGPRSEEGVDLLPHVANVGFGVGPGLEASATLVRAALNLADAANVVLLHHPPETVERR